MILVKLTIMCIIISLIFWCAINICAERMKNATRLKIVLGDPPLWWTIISVLWILLLIVDSIGTVVSAAYMLFFR